MVKPVQLKPLNFSLLLCCVPGKLWLDREGRWGGGGGRSGGNGVVDRTVWVRDR